jgi:hypothetical protein
MVNTGDDWQAALRATIAGWDGKWVILSPDVDGVLSLALLQRYVRSTRGTTPGLLGTYDGGALVLLQQGLAATPEEATDLLGSALWLDLDVCNGCRCIGQHIVQKEAGDRIPGRHPASFNPNVWRDVSVARYAAKYPLGTAHLLVPLVFPGGALPPVGTVGAAGDAVRALLACLAVADSAMANRWKYRRNVDEWLLAFFGAGPSAVRACTELQSLPEQVFSFSQFKTALEQTLLLHTPWVKWNDAAQGTGAVAPKLVEGLAARVAAALAPAWGEGLPDQCGSAPGSTGGALHCAAAPADSIVSMNCSRQRHSAGSTATMPAGLDAWLTTTPIFSYAFTQAGSVNYTEHAGALLQFVRVPAIRNGPPTASSPTTNACPT